LLQLARGFLAFGAGFAFLAPFHAHASLLAFASRHSAPSLLFIEVLRNFFANVARQRRKDNLKQF
jgi:hypothetical protein